MSGLLGMLSALQFLRPWWLLGVLLLPALAWWARHRLSRPSVWQQAVDPHLLPHLLEAGTRRDGMGAWTWRLGMSALLIGLLALAGPSVRNTRAPTWQNQSPLVIAMDLSRASLARDLQPTRLAQARAKVARLLQRRADGQVALVAFSDDAYTVAPLTDDVANVALYLEALSPDVMPVDGHRPDRAIAWSQRLLQQAGQAQGDILLMTDRADSAAVAQAKAAHAAGYRVSVLGLGDVRGGVFEDAAGLQQARLDPSSLRRLAASGGGRYHAIAADDADLQAVGVLTAHPDAGGGAQMGAILRREDVGYWLLPLVLLCCLPFFRRGAVVVLLVCLPGLASLPETAWAQTPGATQGSLWQRAEQVEHAHMQAGVAAYRRKDYKEAIARFTGLQGAEAQYNLGNALAKTGRYDEAIAAYSRALRLSPGMQDALFNKRLVEMAKKVPTPRTTRGQEANHQNDKSQDGKPQEGKPQEGKPQEGKPQEGKPQDAQSTPQQPAAGRSQAGGDGEAGQAQAAKGQRPASSPQTQGQSASKGAPQMTQQQADASQRARMQQALAGQREAGKMSPSKRSPAQAGETAEQRERRLANAAWLQRVPDDPGALLRARFQLEARRRRGEGP